jgi:hypothetical protein
MQMIRLINEYLIKLGLKFGRIDKDNPNQVADRIKSLEAINLRYYNINAVLMMTRNSFSIPVNTWPQVKGHLFYRGQICPKDKPFSGKSRISYNPTPGGNLGRGNLPFRSTFYASSALDTAAIEACQDEIRKSSSREFDLVLGEWELTKDLEACMICHSEDAQKAGTDVGEAVKAIEPLMRKGKTEEQYQAILKVNIFYAKQFAKKEIKHFNDYLFSALFANTIMNSKVPNLKPEALWYPSVAYKYKGFNVVFRTHLIDKNELVLRRVYHYRLKFDNPDSYPQITRIKEATWIDGNSIIW